MPAQILVVDDEVELERLLKMRFRKQIHAKELEFVFAHNGNEALEILSKNRARDIDMVLTDINMPEMDGLTLLGKMGEVYPNLKAVVLSAYGDMNNIRKAMNAGAFDFLTKPINFEDLSITIDKTLKYVKEIRENIAQLQQTQLQLIHQEKMATLGQLVAGVGHEINNPVTCISGYSSLLSLMVQDLMDYVQQDGEKTASLGEIDTEAEKLRIENILNNLLNMISGISLSADRLIHLGRSLQVFSYDVPLSKVLCDIHQGIDSTLVILHYRLKYSNDSAGIKIVKNYGELPRIDCFSGKLNQVFMNLLANAIDACEEENKRFMLAAKPAKEYVITITTLNSESNQNAVKIKDNAGGISQNVKPQIFDHLFTTKPLGKGTGLGLSISRKIVEELHGGSLSCDSVLGEGTEFTIALPV
ncbi:MULTISPECIES: response regulator [unclassified Microcoleus]|uniref:hybrid sensor histidine kinase/response regulator n=1 Tax=unclassified Microcoleus TaxID=2642155 RepID=UPI002FD68005